MNDSEIDKILERGPHEVDAALLSRVTASIGASLRPVRPMPSAWMLVGGLLSISVVVALVYARLLGMYGLHKLSGAEAGAIFPVLGIFACLAAMMSVGEMTPGGRRMHVMNPPILLVVVMVGWLCLDSVLFRDYAMGSFVQEGIPCLRAGLITAIPTGVGAWLVLRRGFAVNPVSAGLAAGTFAGLAGLVMLELHCPNFRAPHVMVWHTAVLPVSGLLGALAALSSRRS
jgi:hypothetical protein